MKEVEVIKAKNALSKQTRGHFLERQRVAAYCRVSTDSEDQLNSYKSQKAYYTDLIKKIRNGFLLISMLMKRLPERKLQSVKNFSE